MKKTENTQNVIVELNFTELNKILRSEDKDGRLLGSQGLFSNGCSYINDEIILHRFAYLRGTMDAIDLLGKILSNIDACLKFQYYTEYKDENLYCTGNIDDECIEIDDILLSESELIGDDNKELYDIVYNNEKEIMIEASKMKKYYKEYYTRLFDRGRTVK